MELQAELFVTKASRETVLRWRLEAAAGLSKAVTLKVRPLLSGRDYHALHHENPAFNFAFASEAQEGDGDGAGPSRIVWQPYGDVPAICASTNGVYTHAPDWYRNFCYVRERERGLDFREDLAAPGVFSFDLGTGPANEPGGHDPERPRAWRADARRASQVRSAARPGARGGRTVASPVSRVTPATFRRCLRGVAQRGPHDHRRISVVHRLGTRHVHRHARPADCIGPLRRSRIDPARMGRHGIRRHVAEPLSRRWQHTGIQLCRRVVVVHRRRA